MKLIMNNQLILKISITIAIIGIISLYIFTTVFENKIAVFEITEFVGERVTVEGTVSDYHVSKDGHVFFEVHDSSGGVDVVAFRNSNIEQAYHLKEGQRIKLTGKVQEYKNELEIIASSIDF